MRLRASGVHKQRQVKLELVYDTDSGGYFLFLHYVGAETASDFWHLRLDDAFAQAQEDFGVTRDQWETVEQ